MREAAGNCPPSATVGSRDIAGTVRWSGDSCKGFGPKVGMHCDV